MKTPPRRSEIALRVHSTLARDGAPLPVSGRVTLPGLWTRAPALGFVGPDADGALAVELEVTAPAGAEPPGRPSDDARRVAVLLAFEVLTVADRLGRTEAGERVARLLGYGGEREVRRVLKAPETVAARAAGRVFVARGAGQPEAFAILATGGDALDSIPDPSGGTARYCVTGWRWLWGEPRATHGTWTFSVTKPNGQ